MTEIIKQLKVILVVNGILGILTAIALFIMFYVYPFFTIRTLTVIMGAYLLIESVLSLYFGIKNRMWTYFVAGLLSLCLVFILLLWPAPTLVGLVWVFGIWAAAIGIGRIMEGVIASYRWKGKAWAITNGLLSIVLSGLLISFPIAGIISFVVILSLFLFLLGLGLVFYGTSLDIIEEEAKSEDYTKNEPATI